MLLVSSLFVGQQVSPCSEGSGHEDVRDEGEQCTMTLVIKVNMLHSNPREGDCILRRK